MKLSEIRKAFEDINEEIKTWPEPKNGDELAIQYQRQFDLLPRVKYADLPVSLQKSVRESFTSEIFSNFLRECYTFDEAVKDIAENDIEKIIIRTRNTATYVIEQNIEGIKPLLYGSDAVAAFLSSSISSFIDASFSI